GADVFNSFGQFAQHGFIEEVVLGTAEGHAGHAAVQANLYEFVVFNLLLLRQKNEFFSIDRFDHLSYPSWSMLAWRFRAVFVLEQDWCAKSLLSRWPRYFAILWSTMSFLSAATGTAIALALSGALDHEGFPTPEAWARAQAVQFDADWQGANSDAQRETEVRLLWTRATLFLRFRCRYRNLTTFPDSDPDGRRYQLWDRDVAEVFLQPDPADPHRYWELEISPDGKWIDLDINLEKPPGNKEN